VAPAAASATPREPEAALDQVVVTVQRRKEAAQSVPLSISALSGEQMKTPT
jgi:outer membrane receptor protein involved in Fe transport